MNRRMHSGKNSNIIIVLLAAAFLTIPVLSAATDGDNKKMLNPYLDYKSFPTDGLPGEYLGKKVTFTGRFAVEIWQHMIRGEEDKPYIQSFYIDPDEEYVFLHHTKPRRAYLSTRRGSPHRQTRPR